ncbi:ATP-binding protein [Streptomyces sp. NPDC001820]|uniref:ATP-binding protein n=1 Tax=Streptomyces sp. NPDC001820 TaxID=3364613 RepID=UPI00367D28D1
MIPAPGASLPGNSRARRATSLVIDERSVGAARAAAPTPSRGPYPISSTTPPAKRPAGSKSASRPSTASRNWSPPDDGHGIPQADRRRVLDRFTRPDDSRARDTGGRGLGLAIVYEIVTAHRGSTCIEDNAPGARLVVRLPAAGS